jgi:two-component system CheB/CheR fusion protein
LKKKTAGGSTKKKHSETGKRLAAKPARKNTTKKKDVKKNISTKKTAKQKVAKQTKSKTSAQEEPTRKFLLVGIGASAGGLEALEKLVSNIKNPQNAAFIVVQHLSPNYKSTMDNLLQRHTRLNVLQASDRARVRPGCMYLNPPDKDIFLKDGKLSLRKQAGARGHRLPIDTFFRSLAADQRDKAVCIVLSGTGSDGTMGLRAVKDEGGMVLVQKESQAKYDSMPKNAIATGLVDQVLPVEEMPALLDSLITHPYHAGPAFMEQPEEKDLDHIRQMLELIHRKTSQDFFGYKQNTISRRIHRRMAISQVNTVEDYVRYLKKSPREIETLSRELLIGVTSFFRDTEAFKVLQRKALIPLIKTREEHQGIRVWVPGCATGEEAYSIAILLKEMLSKVGKDLPVHIFATDLDNRSIEIARKGMYPASIDANVTPERLKAFFRKAYDKYIINKDIRGMVVFSRHNVTQDPPFSKMDLVCCRNLLIYFSSALQKNVLRLFHYSLSEGGYLFLGVSETPGEIAGDLVTISSKYKLFKRNKGTQKTRGKHHIPSFSPSYNVADVTEAREGERPLNIHELATQILLKDHSPSYVLIDAQLRVLYLQGETKAYLALPSGEPSYNILDLARSSIRHELTMLAQKAVKQKKTFESGEMRITSEVHLKSFHIIVRPLPRQFNAPELFMVIFEEKAAARGFRQKKKGKADPRYESLELELDETKDHIRNLREEFDATNEELTSANEELQSTNEELQSTNEELETSKEELESTNEELESTNAELRDTVVELEKTNDDIKNLMASTDVGTVFLDTKLCITRYTPKATDMFNLIQSDIGRPITDMTLNAKYDNIIVDLKKVLVDLSPLETEISTRQPLLVLDEQLNVVRANRAFSETLGIRLKEALGRRIYDLGSHQFNSPELIKMLEEVLPKDKEIYDYKVDLQLKEQGVRNLLINARRLQVEEKGTQSILLAIEDITERYRMVEQLGKANKRLETLLKEMNHRVKNNLAIIQTLLKLQAREVEDEISKGYFLDAEARVKSISLIHEMLYHATDLSSINFQEYLSKLVRSIASSYKESRVEIDLNLASVNLDFNKILPLGLIVAELIANSYKYAFPGNMSGRIAIDLSRMDNNDFVLTVKDDGIGISEDFDINKSDSFGMKIVTSLVMQIRGKLEINRDSGTAFVIKFKDEKQTNS